MFWLVFDVCLCMRACISVLICESKHTKYTEQRKRLNDFLIVTAGYFFFLACSLTLCFPLSIYHYVFRWHGTILLSSLVICLQWNGMQITEHIQIGNAFVCTNCLNGLRQPHPVGFFPALHPMYECAWNLLEYKPFANCTCTRLLVHSFLELKTYRRNRFKDAKRKERCWTTHQAEQLASEPEAKCIYKFSCIIGHATDDG